MDKIGHPLTPRPERLGNLRFVYWGRPETLAQAAFFGAIGFGLLYTDVERGLPYFLFAVAILLALGGFANCLEFVDLRIDLAGKSWRLRRGLVFKPARVEGSLDDFSAVVLVREHLVLDEWFVALYPRGSYRAYVLGKWPGDQARAAETFARELANQLSLPLRTEAPQRGTELLKRQRIAEITAGADLLKPRPGGAMVIAPLPEGLEVQFLKKGRLVESLRVLDGGLQHWVAFLGRPREVHFFRWEDITDISIETLPAVGNRPNKFYLRPDWRERMGEWWQARSAELKREPRDPPGWAFILFFAENSLFRPVRALMIRTGRHSTRFASEKILGDEEMAWLAAALNRRWEQARGGRAGDGRLEPLQPDPRGGEGAEGLEKRFSGNQ